MSIAIHAITAKSLAAMSVVLAPTLAIAPTSVTPRSTAPALELLRRLQVRPQLQINGQAPYTIQINPGQIPAAPGVKRHSMIPDMVHMPYSYCPNMTQMPPVYVYPVTPNLRGLHIPNALAARPKIMWTKP